MNTRSTPAHLAHTTQAGLLSTLPINKIVVVGHPLSGFEDVGSLLNRCGMQAAEPSQREGLSPADIGATLLKAHRVTPLNALQAHGAIHPLQPGPIWQSLALDLLLGNINHDLWGWSDPQAVYLLDYWKSLDPQLAFMLVYDTPEDLIARAFDNPAVPCTPETLQVAVDNWQAYNEALLHFYHRNPQRCMLVHAAQVRESAADYLQQVQTRIGAPLGIEGESEPAPATPATPDTQNALRRYLAQHIVDAQPQALTLYEELQAVASLPKSAPNTIAQQPAAASQALEALQSLLEQQQQQHTSTQRIQAAQTRIQTLEQEQTQLRENLHASQNGQAESLQEIDLLLGQLHQVQEELEKLHLEGQDRHRQLVALTQAQTEAEKTIVKVEAEKAKARAEAEANNAAAKAAAAQLIAEQEKAKSLTEQLAARAPAAQSNELQQENDLLLAQLHQVQEELERYYLENQRLKAKPTLPSAPSKPTPPPAPYGAAERVKRQLSYRLGSKMIERSRSLGGWLGMPFALVGVARQYKRELPQRQAAKQIPIEKYRDAYEAERVKHHLSYRLGAALIKHGKNPLRWPALPFALNKARQQWLRQQAR